MKDYLQRPNTQKCDLGVAVRYASGKVVVVCLYGEPKTKMKYFSNSCNPLCLLEYF